MEIREVEKVNKNYLDLSSITVDEAKEFLESIVKRMEGFTFIVNLTGHIN